MSKQAYSAPATRHHPVTGSSERVQRRRNSYKTVKLHSRFVKFLKFFIPLGSVVIVAGIVTFLWLDPFRKIEHISVENVEISGTQITMEAPKLIGFNKGARPYKVTAHKAIQDLQNMHVIFLTRLDALFSTETDDSGVHVLADSGIYDTQTEHLEIKDNIVVTTADGQKIMMSSASIDMEAGTVRSREPVDVQFPDGEIHAQGLEVFNNGDLISFRRNVEATFYAKLTEETSPQPISQQSTPDSVVSENDLEQISRESN